MSGTEITMAKLNGLSGYYAKESYKNCEHEWHNVGCIMVAPTGNKEHFTKKAWSKIEGKDFKVSDFVCCKCGKVKK